MSGPSVAAAEPRSTTLLFHHPLRLGLAAVWSHTRHEIIVHKGRTVVFD